MRKLKYLFYSEMKKCSLTTNTKTQRDHHPESGILYEHFPELPMSCLAREVISVFKYLNLE